MLSHLRSNFKLFFVESGGSQINSSFLLILSFGGLKKRVLRRVVQVASISWIALCQSYANMFRIHRVLLTPVRYNGLSLSIFAPFYRYVLNKGLCPSCIWIPLRFPPTDLQELSRSSLVLPHRCRIFLSVEAGLVTF